MKQDLKLILIISFCAIMLVTNRVYVDANILVFHRFGDQRYPSTNISKEKLREIFNFFKENNYQVVSLDKIVSYIEDNKEIPDKTVAITIDDGYKSFYENGLEIFKEYKYPFTIFINTKAVNRHYGDFLTWDN